MRRTQINTTEKSTKTCKISVPNINPLPLTTIVLTLTSLERTGGET